MPIMKRCLVFICLLFSGLYVYGQAYISMPTDSGARWRYRLYDIDFTTQVLDNIIFLNGKDTVAGGYTYHQLMSRTHVQTVPIDSVPPELAYGASYADLFYGSIRESGKKVYFFSGAVEQLIFDFSVAVGDSIPAYGGKRQVIAIDSVLLNGVYHKRYRTTDTSYYTIEGVGSNRGLIPGLNDGTGNQVFYCYTNDTLFYSPDTAQGCTYIYPLGYGLATIDEPGSPADIKIFPVPVHDVLHVSVPVAELRDVTVYNEVGQVVWYCKVSGQASIHISTWPKGHYYMQLTGPGANEMRRFVVE